MRTTRRLQPPDGLDIVELIRRELAPLANSLEKLTSDHATKTDVQQLRDDLQAVRRETYSREMLDAKMSDLRNDISDLQTAFRDARKGQIDERERLWLRSGVVASVLWTLIQVLPHLANIFK